MTTQDGPAIMVDNLLPLRRSLRVAVVTETYPPEVNGVAATISQVVQGLCARGHELQLVRPRQDKADTPTDKGPCLEVLMRGLPIPRYPQLKMGLPSKRALIQLWTTRRPDVVHIVTEGPLGWSALQAAVHLRLPIVSDFRTNFHAYSKHYGIAWLRHPITAYLRKFHNRTACTMVPTETLRAELAQAGFRRLRVVARGVDTQRFDPAHRSDVLREQWGADADTVVALYVGRLAPEKNLDALIAAVRHMRLGHAGLKLVVVGDGPERARLMEHCPDAVFAGVRRGDELSAHYASADVFLFPSMTETFGNVVPEAMASGLAVVAFDHAAAGQLIKPGVSGLLAPLDDTPDFCRLARELASDLTRVRELGTNARSSANRLAWGQIVEAVETEYGAAMPTLAGPPTPAWAPVVQIT